jgi:predicted DNA-binding protein with PD1-like motif
VIRGQEDCEVEKSLKDDLLLVRLSDGDDLEGSLKKVLKEKKIASGIVIGGVGMVRNAGLSFYVGEGQYETVSTMDGEIVIHLHATVGKEGGAALAGHLSGGQVNMTAEIAVLATPQKLVRYSDPDTGLRLLRFE